jgi:hypothetical protein
MNLPDNFPHKSPEFQAEWADWVEYRKKELKAPLGPIAVKKQAKLLASWDEATAIASLEQSMRCGYQGLFPPAKSITHCKTVNFHQEGGGF